VSQGVLRVSQGVLKASQGVLRLSQGVLRLSHLAPFFGAIFGVMKKIKNIYFAINFFYPIKFRNFAALIKILI
jgi:hypothetical protein